MAFKITLKDWIALFLSKQATEATLSISPNKKFMDVKEYIESGKFGKSVMGRITKQTDNGTIYRYEYECHDTNKSSYRVTVKHMGEKVDTVELYKYCPAALTLVKSNLNDFEKKVPDIPAGEVVIAEVVPPVDYSVKELNELVDIFDKKLTAFSKNAMASELGELIKIKDCMSDKINLKPLTERAPFTKAIGNLTTYLDALNMQMSSPLANTIQFVSVYVPQMQTAIAELAALLA